MKHEVLFDEIKGQGGDIGLMTLNRPEVLNSINENMVKLLYQQLKHWEQQANIKGVVIQAVPGRAFCAGGDLRSTYENQRATQATLTSFFRHEYRLNSCIFHYPKPYIAFLNGITMGGGVGISIHGSHRIATDHLLFAMPETGIGLFPDVGGTYFLPRLPHYIGYYLGLVGARIKSDEAYHLGIATQKVDAEKLEAVLRALAETPFQTKQEVDRILQPFQVEAGASAVLENKAIIEKCFSLPTMEEIIYNLKQINQPFTQECLNALATKSPTSLKVTLKALQEGKHLNFNEAMIQEFRLVTHFLQGHDFKEGVRALIIDKDKNPQWRPAKLEEVTTEAVNQYFQPVHEELSWAS